MSKLNFSKGVKNTQIKLFDYDIYYNDERKEALSLCGWSALVFSNKSDDSL